MACVRILYPSESEGIVCSQRGTGTEGEGESERWGHERESDNAWGRVSAGGRTDTTKGDRERLEIAQDQYLAGSQGLQEPEEILTTGPQGSPPAHDSQAYGPPLPFFPSLLPVPASWE